MILAASGIFTLSSCVGAGEGGPAPVINDALQVQQFTLDIPILAMLLVGFGAE
jgi:hypothetical protein